MATKVLNTRYEITIAVTNEGAPYVYMKYTFDTKMQMLNFIKNFDSVTGPSPQNYTITFYKHVFSYDDETKRITKISTVLTAEDL